MKNKHDTSYRQQCLAGFSAQLKAHGLTVDARKRQAGNPVVVSNAAHPGERLAITLLCATKGEGNRLLFPIERTTVEQFRADVPYLQSFPRGTCTKASLPSTSFLVVSGPDNADHFWVLPMSAELASAFSPTPGPEDEMETEFSLDPDARVGQLSARELLDSGLNRFDLLANAQEARNSAPPDTVLKFTLAELEAELRAQLEVIGVATSFHFSVGSAAYLSGNPDYIASAHHDKHSLTSHHLHATDDFQLRDLEDCAITFQVRRLYALAFDNSWDNLISDCTSWRNIELAIDRLDDFVRMAELNYHLPMVFDQSPPSRLRALSLMAKGRVRLLCRLPVPIPQFAALAQISDRSMTNLISRQGVLAKARVSYANEACIDPLKALEWIDRRPLFHRNTGLPLEADGYPFTPLTTNEDSLLLLIGEMFTKITETLADGKTINDFFADHGYTPEAESCLRRSMKRDHAWIHSESDEDAGSRQELMACLVRDIENNFPDFPNRKKWLWAMRYYQYYF